MKPSPSHIDPKEMDLIDRVAKRIDPEAWTTLPLDRARARGLALDIIEEVRNHDAAETFEEELAMTDEQLEARMGVNKARMFRILIKKVVAARRAEPEGE